MTALAALDDDVLLAESGEHQKHQVGKGRDDIFVRQGAESVADFRRELLGLFVVFLEFAFERLNGDKSLEHQRFAQSHSVTGFLDLQEVVDLRLGQIAQLHRQFAKAQSLAFLLLEDVCDLGRA